MLKNIYDLNKSKSLAWFIWIEKSTNLEKNELCLFTNGPIIMLKCKVMTLKLEIAVLFFSVRLFRLTYLTLRTLGPLTVRIPYLSMSYHQVKLLSQPRVNFKWDLISLEETFCFNSLFMNVCLSLFKKNWDVDTTNEQLIKNFLYYRFLKKKSSRFILIHFC